MKLVVRASVLSSVVALGAMATGSPAGAGAAPPPAPPAATPDQMVMDVTRGVSEGRLYVAWDALPASYQQDVTEVVHAYAAKVDAELWDHGFALVGKVGMMLQSKKGLILSMPQFSQAPGFDLDRVTREWDLVVAPFMTIANSDLGSVSTLQRIDVRQFLATTGAELMQDIVKLSTLAPDQSGNKLATLGRTKATLVSQDGDSAVVRIETPGQSPVTETFVRVEGKWLPQDIVNDWADEMASAHASIEKMSPEKLQNIKPKVMSILASIDSMVDQLELAQSPQQFEQTFQMGMFQAFGGVMEIAQAI
jgi:hypothetical protein